MIDFVQLFQCHNIPYITEGPNVARGNINISCPFCADQDPSQHLGIRLSDGAWGCWRDPFHRGRKPHRLLQRLLQWSYTHTDSFVGIDRTMDVASLAYVSSSQKFGHKYVHAPVQFPDNFRPITDSPATQLHWDYLRQRGYETKNLTTFIQHYDLRAAVTGEWAHRILIPIYNQYGDVTTWVGRAIGAVVPRYKALEKERSELITHTLWTSKYWQQCTILCVTEGPFDAMTLDWYGHEYGVSATCIFGASMSNQQETLLRMLYPHVKKIVIVLDRENLSGTLQLTQQLVGLPVFPMSLSKKDPGKMSQKEVQNWITDIKAKIQR